MFSTTLFCRWSIVSRRPPWSSPSTSAPTFPPRTKTTRPGKQDLCLSNKDKDEDSANKTRSTWYLLLLIHNGIFLKYCIMGLHFWTFKKPPCYFKPIFFFLCHWFSLKEPLWYLFSIQLHNHRVFIPITIIFMNDNGCLFNVKWIW